MIENESLQSQLEQAVSRQEFLVRDMTEMQEQYTELRRLFAAAEEELVRYRTAPPRSHSNDSLYDSLLSELENNEHSDSGFGSSTPGPSARTHKSLHLELAALEVNTNWETKIDFVQLSPVTEIASTTTPLSVQIPETSRAAPLTCDASTSTIALDSGIGLSEPTTSSPVLEKLQVRLYFLAHLCVLLVDRISNGL